MKKKKVFSLIIILLITMFALTGCVNVDYNVNVKKDGSGDITYLYGVQKNILEEMQISPETIIEEMKQEVIDSKYNVESYETDSEVGFKATKHLEDVTTELSLEEAFGEEYVTDSEQNNLKIEKNGLEIKYSQNAIIDLRSMEDMSYMGITMRYSVTLPVEVNEKNTNGTVSEDGKTITWDLIVGEINNISFEATGVSNFLWIMAAILIGVLIVAGIVLVVMFKYLNKKHNKKTSVLDEEDE